MSIFTGPDQQTIFTNQLGSVVSFNGNEGVKQCVTGSVHVESADWDGAVLELVRSNDAVSWYVLEYPVTFAADGMSETLDLHAYAFLGVRVATASGTADTTASATFFGYTE